MNKILGWVMVVFCTHLLSGCLGTVWTGASMVYDRHNVYKSMSDYELSVLAQHGLYCDHLFKEHRAVLDLGIKNGDILLAGRVPTEALRDEAYARIQKAVPGYRRFFKQVRIGPTYLNTLDDSWITTKIRSQIIADSSIDPNAFKIITSDGVVYVMGDVDPVQAKKVIDIARFSNGVVRVVRLLKYFNLSDKPAE